MDFSHYLLISRVYKFDGASDDMDMAEDAASNKYVSVASLLLVLQSIPTTVGSAELTQSVYRRPASKKSKKQQQAQAQTSSGIPGGLMHYHPEEEFLERVRLLPVCATILPSVPALHCHCDSTLCKY
jgi:hypothetical protein